MGIIGIMAYPKTELFYVKSKKVFEYIINDKNVHRFTSSAIRGELLEKERERVSLGTL